MQDTTQVALSALVAALETLDLDWTDCPRCGALVTADGYGACNTCGDDPHYDAALNGTRIA